MQPKRLQGTDGIRRPIARGDEPHLKHLKPLTILLRHDVLTPAFFHLYCYSFVRLLMEQGDMLPGDEVLIGTDPRDTSGAFHAEVMQAVEKAGACAVDLGVVPTPAVPFLVAKRSAAAGIMLTASHNPPEHHGIKLFLPGDQKAYPKDDEALTARVFEFAREKRLLVYQGGSNKCIGSEASSAFLAFITNPRNTWLTQEMPLERCILLVDPAYGSYTDLASAALRRVGFENVIELNRAPDAPVNHLSGVADLEGHSHITREQIEPGAFFGAYPAIQSIFRLANQHHKELLSGDNLLIGLVFDADGDRFFCLPYLPHRDELVVLSGDETAILQASYIARTGHGEMQHGLYINTVESDLEAARQATKLGFATRLVAVGDKWVLREAQLARLESILAFVKNNCGLVERMVVWQGLYDALCLDSNAPAMALWRLQREIISELPESQLAAFHEQVSDPTNLRYAVGSEETGHNITAAMGVRGNGSRFLTLAGNGLKSAFNTLAALLARLSKKPADKAFWVETEEPFPHGFKGNLYIYWVNKKLFTPASSFRRMLRRFVLRKMHELLPDMTANEEPHPEEETMAYFSGLKNNEQLVACFVRPSGTEDKAGIYLRGPQRLAGILQKLGEEIAVWAWHRLRSSKNPRVVREESVLGEMVTKEVSLIELTSWLKENGASDAAEEIFVLTAKEKLLEQKDGAFRLTDMGRRLVQKNATDN